ncbi:juvenile hormone acid O-methyltransferase-like isoform X1 [Rhipicephalus microplus]|uniref:juvenile hormone acid O-methyltransferase-like isoform X1 n=2 Tax=Rhipicephalus microplus TaxID=6941 RepID=UPI003F6CD42E
MSPQFHRFVLQASGPWLTRLFPSLHAMKQRLTTAKNTVNSGHSMAPSCSETKRNDRLPPMQRAATNSPRLSAIQYAKNNGPQKKHNELVLAFCQPAFLVEPSDTLRILDVGCGTGDFTRDGLLPCCLPCAKIVGVDVSPEMIEHARRHSEHEKIEYELLNIGGNVTEFLRRYGHFDRVYSFYCLQWLKDQSTALKNIASLLFPGGQCLLVIPASQQPAAVWNRLAQMDRWKKYSEILTKHVSKSHTMKSKKEQLAYMSAMLREAHLSPSIFVLPRLVTFEGWSEEDVIAAHMGIVPINLLVAEEEKNQLLEDVTTLVKEIHGPGSDQSLFRNYVIMATKY